MPKRLNEVSPTKKVNPTPDYSRVDFDEWVKESNNLNRGMNAGMRDALEQLQDSLISRGIGFAQRLSTLATSAQEMDKDAGAASRGVGGNGIIGLNEYRMPLTYLGNTPKARGKQIHHILEDMTHIYKGTHPQAGNWNDGKHGGPVIKTGQEAYDRFWNNKNVEDATIILNKNYVRPAGGFDSWQNRAKVAKEMQKHLYRLGGRIKMCNVK